MGFSALRSIADSVGVEVDDDPDPDSDLHLTYEEYPSGIARITSTTFAV